MTYPTNLEAVSGLPGTWMVDVIPATYTTNQQFEVYTTKGWYQPDANGITSSVPLGTSGPFVVKVDNEQILCSSISGNIITVWASGGLNGRGWNSTTMASHSAGGSANQHVTAIYGSVQGGLPSAGTTQTFTSGTAVQNTASTWATYYIGITGGAAGTVSVAIGSTSAATTTIIPAATGNAVSSQTVHIRVPSSWWIKVTTSVATINASSVIVLDSI